MVSRISIGAIALVFLASTAPVRSQVFDEVYDHWPENLRVGGTVVAGTDLTAQVIGEFLPGESTPVEGTLIHGTTAGVLMRELAPQLEHAGDRLSSVEMAADLAAQLESLSGTLDLLVLLRLEKLPFDPRVATRLRAILDGGGTIVCDGTPVATAALGALTTLSKAGHDLIPDCFLATQFSDAQSERGKILSVLAQHPRKVGIGVESGSAVVLTGRKIRVSGDGELTAILMANDREPIRVQAIAEQRSRRQAPEEFLIDLTEWRRDAVDRTLAPFPPLEPRVPSVDAGSLVIVGGGGLPGGLMDTFIELAGGKDKARLVFIPCEERASISGTPSIVTEWIDSGVAHATFLHTKDRRRANTDDAFLKPLRKATGIWFGGGRQWNFSDSYYGTTAHRLMKEVLHRGGVIGGSSAGASVQARYLARATPIGNFRIMAPGYERGGLGFLSGVAIDQHFSQRGRQKDMTELMDHHPQLLGIGIDETTALIVKGATAEIVGAGRVFFYDRNLPVFPDRPDYVAVEAGAKYDLAQRRALDASER